MYPGAARRLPLSRGLRERNTFVYTIVTTIFKLALGLWLAMLLNRHFKGKALTRAVILLPFRPFWSLGVFLAAYVIMFFGHFAFERNTPTILKHPSTPFVMAYSVIRGICGGLRRVLRRCDCLRVNV